MIELVGVAPGAGSQSEHPTRELGKKTKFNAEIVVRPG